MLQFQPITLNSIHTFVPYLAGHNGRLCDFTPVNLFVWMGYYYESYAVWQDMLYLRLLAEDGGYVYAVPMGQGDIDEALRTLKEHTAALGEPLRLSLVPVEKVPVVRRVFGGTIREDSNPIWCDYVYDAPRMAAFEGRDYAKQRNHVRRFDRLYPEHRVEWLSPSHVTDIDRFLETFAEKRGKTDELAYEEIERTRRAFAHMTELSLVGVVLYVDEELVGFSAGTRLHDTLYVHFEKADTAYDGVYQKLVKSFATAFADDSVRYINREEDCGDEGLRKSKQAYHPIALLEKWNVTVPLD
ncbi:MAG: GNAT family N-acetyltransferase [Clostridia bacterium]|nr:GNAT family N-acetyltransferase [Clostridia bacterium]